MAKNKNNKQAAPTSRKHSQNEMTQRSFAAAVRNRVTNDFGEIQNLNISIKQGLNVLRARSRDLCAQNEYATRYMTLITNNVIGPDGIQLSVNAVNPDGSYDSMSDRVEQKYYDWTKAKNCDVTGRLDFTQLSALVLESTARDGECLVIIRRGLEFGAYGIQLQVITSDHLDENYNDIGANGNQIVQSVEVNKYGKPVAYHVWSNNPTDQYGRANERIRIDAKDIIHVYSPESASQMRGYPWLTPAMLSLQHLVKFREAVLVNARLSAIKQTYFKQGENVGYSDDEIDDYGNVSQYATPGENSILPRGWDVVTSDWKAPTDTLGNFQKEILRGVAASLSVSYNALAADAESVSYSSARFSALDDQSHYRVLQSWFVGIFSQRVYEEWLEMQLLLDTWGLNIPAQKFEKFAQVTYRPRGFSSVDPVKDLNGEVIALENNLTSYTDVITKLGRDPETIFAQIAKDKVMMEKYGITKQDVINTVQK